MTNALGTQKRAVAVWLNSIRLAASTKIQPGDEVTEQTLVVRHRFCEVVAEQLRGVIDGQDGERGEQDGLLYAMVVMSQIYGVYVGLLGLTPDRAMPDLFHAIKHMIQAYQDTYNDTRAALEKAAVH